MIQTLQAIRGMNDILPDDAEQWEEFEALIRDWLHSYGYRPIRMPIVESTDLFSRAIGEVTDIVEKEMYSFEDRLNGEQLTLRPEGTASCVRAALQHNLLYDGGITFKVTKNIQINFPLIACEDFRNNYNSVYSDKSAFVKWANRITFVFNINNMNPIKAVQNFSAN